MDDIEFFFKDAYQITPEKRTFLKNLFFDYIDANSSRRVVDEVKKLLIAQH